MISITVIYRSNDFLSERYSMHNDAEILTGDGLFKIPSENGWVFIPVDTVHTLSLKEAS